MAFICTKIGIPKQEPKVEKIRQFKNFNIGELQHDLKEAFGYFTFHSDPNTALHEWKETFYQIADFHVPYRSRKVRNNSCPWLNSGIKKLSYHRNYLKKQAVKLKSVTYHEAYKKCKSQVTKLIKSFKKHHYQTKLKNSNNSKDSRKYLNELLDRKPKRTTVNQLKIDGQTVDGNENIANEFNKFFCEIGPKMAEKVPTNNVDRLQYITPCTSLFALNKSVSRI